MKSFVSQKIHFRSIDSTNTWAKNHCDKWSSDGITVVSADYQTQGRGRFNRSWISPPLTNITLSFCFWLSPQEENVGNLPQVLAISVAEILSRKGVIAHIKWPNDVCINGKKIAGILTETIQEGDRRGIILGIGLNVNMDPKSLSFIDRPATSLFAETKNYFPLFPLQQELQEAFVSHLSLFLQKGFEPFYPNLKKLSMYQKGDHVQFHNNQQVIEATFEAIQADGSVMLRLKNNQVVTYLAGEFISTI